ncbi:hypothetical protein QP166_13720 [Sphingomonas sp. LR60]|uniref:hypothetical protein n=1 Tax=Sphingomonas sp. LR60 TaxID=3050233 RepID=UPI002FE394E4
MRLRIPKNENQLLKKLLAASMLDVSALKDLLGKLTRPAARYAAVEKQMAEGKRVSD